MFIYFAPSCVYIPPSSLPTPLLPPSPRITLPRHHHHHRSSTCLTLSHHFYWLPFLHFLQTIVKWMNILCYALCWVYIRIHNSVLYIYNNGFDEDHKSHKSKANFPSNGIHVLKALVVIRRGNERDFIYLWMSFIVSWLINNLYSLAVFNIPFIA